MSSFYANILLQAVLILLLLTTTTTTSTTTAVSIFSIASPSPNHQIQSKSQFFTYIISLTPISLSSLATLAEDNKSLLPLSFLCGYVFIHGYQWFSQPFNLWVVPSINRLTPILSLFLYCLVFIILNWPSFTVYHILMHD